jgi:hypothetical protein
VLHAARLQSDDEWLHRKILAEAMQELARAEDDATPAEIVHAVGRRAARALGVGSPYLPDKRRWLEAAAGAEASLREAIRASPDPFREALKLSVAANLIDCEFRDEVVPGFSVKTIREEGQGLVFAVDNAEELRQAVAGAGRVLFVHESAGELVFDRLLIETFGKPASSVVSVVRESSSLGSATREDAEAVGLERVARVIDPGIACRGIPLSAASEDFREEFAAADLVVAKGQAAYETLEGEGGEINGARKPTFFLLRVRCTVIARELGVEVGDCVVESG